MKRIFCLAVGPRGGCSGNETAEIMNMEQKDLKVTGEIFPILSCVKLWLCHSGSTTEHVSVGSQS